MGRGGGRGESGGGEGEKGCGNAVFAVRMREVGEGGGPPITRRGDGEEDVVGVNQVRSEAVGGRGGGARIEPLKVTSNFGGNIKSELVEGGGQANPKGNIASGDASPLELSGARWEGEEGGRGEGGARGGGERGDGEEERGIRGARGAGGPSAEASNSGAGSVGSEFSGKFRKERCRAKGRK